ncbi:unnamed protein product [Strongylus vulgaris]|uniref:Uncharacterized protein n=1 Tax=Strongylus vulgaris TaxID=40348 RepID=A0A3P7IYM0_STRVU|nr:unnamed protein product [Strongylus vulgaris]
MNCGIATNKAYVTLNTLFIEEILLHAILSVDCFIMMYFRISVAFLGYNLSIRPFPEAARIRPYPEVQTSGRGDSNRNQLVPIAANQLEVDRTNLFQSFVNRLISRCVTVHRAHTPRPPTSFILYYQTAFSSFCLPTWVVPRLFKHLLLLDLVIL